MRTLYLVRHAKSSWQQPGLRDFDRPLNERGLHDAPRMAQLLAKHEVKPDLIVSSPAKRALATAVFFAEAFGLGANDVKRDPNIYEAYPAAIQQIISDLPHDASTVMIFGHNPTFTDVANHFTEDFIDNLPTCGVVKINSDAETWSSFYKANSAIVAWFFPKELF